MIVTLMSLQNFVGMNIYEVYNLLVRLEEAYLNGVSLNKG
jgi:hypothetical protein